MLPYTLFARHPGPHASEQENDREVHGYQQDTVVPAFNCTLAPWVAGVGATARSAQASARASSAALSVTSKEAEAIAGARQSRLDTQRKLQLVLDLDHTLLECSTDKRASNVEGVVSLGNVAGRPHWVRLRPGLRQFFDAVRPLYELAIYTHGSRAYAAGVAKALIERLSLIHI